MYYKGLGVVQDYHDAFKWTKMAADQGNASAQYNLGLMYDEGKGVRQDYKMVILVIMEIKLVVICTKNLISN